MSANSRRLMIVAALLVLFIAVAAWLISSGNKKFVERYNSFVRQFDEVSQQEAVTDLSRELRFNRDFAVYMTSFLRKPDINDEHQCAAAHALALSIDSEFALMSSTRYAAFKYRYRNGLSLLTAGDYASAKKIIDHEKPEDMAASKNYEALFWSSFHSTNALRYFYIAFGFDEFQRLLQAILFYPYDRYNEGPFPATPARAAAVACISYSKLNELIEGRCDLPFNLLNGIKYDFKPPVLLENEIGFSETLEWYKVGMAARPEVKVKMLSSISRHNSDEARQMVSKAFADGEIPVTDADVFFLSCYNNGIIVPEAYIEEGLKSPDENIRLRAMMNVLNLEPDARRRMLRSLIGREDLFTKYMLVHRMNEEEIDAGSLDMLKRQLKYDLTGDWGVSRLEALIISAKVYENFGGPGLAELLEPELFEKHATRVADIIELMGGPAQVITYEAMVKWTTTLEGMPVWWVIGKSIMPDKPKPEQLHGIALREFYRARRTNDERVPPTFWRPLFVADALNKSPRNKKDFTLPLKMFGLMPFDNEWIYLEYLFRQGDKGNADAVLSDLDVLGEFFYSFETRLME